MSFIENEGVHSHVCSIESTCRSKFKPKSEEYCRCRNKATLVIDCTYRRKCNVCNGYHRADFNIEQYDQDWFIENHKRSTGVYHVLFKDMWVTARYGVDETFSAYCLPVTAYWWIPGETKILRDAYIQQIGDKIS